LESTYILGVTRHVRRTTGTLEARVSCAVSKRRLESGWLLACAMGPWTIGPLEDDQLSIEDLEGDSSREQLASAMAEIPKCAGTR
jgi:hypothetical protein